MLEVVTPTCRAISAIDNPNSSMPGVSHEGAVAALAEPFNKQPLILVIFEDVRFINPTNHYVV